MVRPKSKKFRDLLTINRRIREVVQLVIYGEHELFCSCQAERHSTSSKDWSEVEFMDDLALEALFDNAILANLHTHIRHLPVVFDRYEEFEKRIGYVVDCITKSLPGLVTFTVSVELPGPANLAAVELNIAKASRRLRALAKLAAKVKLTIEVRYPRHNREIFAFEEYAALGRSVLQEIVGPMIVGEKELLMGGRGTGKKRRIEDEDYHPEDEDSDPEDRKRGRVARSRKRKGKHARLRRRS